MTTFLKLLAVKSVFFMLLLTISHEAHADFKKPVCRELTKEYFDYCAHTADLLEEKLEKLEKYLEEIRKKKAKEKCDQKYMDYFYNNMVKPCITVMLKPNPDRHEQCGRSRAKRVCSRTLAQFRKVSGCKTKVYKPVWRRVCTIEEVRGRKRRVCKRELHPNPQCQGIADRADACFKHQCNGVGRRGGTRQITNKQCQNLLETQYTGTRAAYEFFDRDCPKIKDPQCPVDAAARIEIPDNNIALASKKRSAANTKQFKGGILGFSFQLEEENACNPRHPNEENDQNPVCGNGICEAGEGPTVCKEEIPNPVCTPSTTCTETNGMPNCIVNSCEKICVNSPGTCPQDCAPIT